MPPAKPAEESEPVGLPSTCATGSTAKLSPAPKLNAVEFISGRNPADERADQGERGEQQQGDAEDQQPDHHRPPGRAELAHLVQREQHAGHREHQRRDAQPVHPGS
jgi:hypothetical protein